VPRVKLPIKLLYLDIETSPHQGTFWNLFPKFIPINQVKKPTEVLCWAAKWHNDREVIYRKHSDPDFITKMWDLLNEADAVVHYNGKNFDIKHLNREFAKAGFCPPSPYAQIDLLTTVRASFKLASNKLDYVCRYFGLGSKVKHVGIELWYDCMDGDPEAWKIMERYNRRDVVLLPKLYKFLLPWIKNHPNVGLYKKDPTRPTCSFCGSTNIQSRGTYRTKAGVYSRWWCNGCGVWLRSRKMESATSENVLQRAN
jgi:DNA polymerase elongation subunit (family B)